MRSLRFTNTKPWDFQGLENTYDLEDDMVIESVEGLGYPDMQIASQQAPFQDGESHLDQTFRPREIVVTAALRVVSLGDVTTKKREISRKLSPAGSGFRQTSNSVNSPMDTYLGTLSYASDGSTYDRHIDCIVRSLVFTNRRYTDGLQRLRITFHCPSPFWYGAEVVETLERVAGMVQGSFRDVTYAEGKYVAVGQDVTAYSTDGEIWTLGTIPAGLYVSIAHNGTTFVAVGASNLCANSADGITWTSQTISAGSYNSVTSNGTIFCAVGTNVIATSPDGVTWTPQTYAGGTLQAVTFASSKFVAIGQTTGYTSADGVTWVAFSSAPAGSYRGITWDGSKFIAVGQSQVTPSLGVIATSTDGSSWTVGTIPNGSYLRISYLNGVYVATENSNNAVRSTDALTWTAITDYPNFGTAFTGITSLNGLFMNVGLSQILKSSDGLSWQRIGSYSSWPGTFNALTTNGQRFVVSVGTVKTSSFDGVLWTPGSIGANLVSQNAMAYGNDIFVSVGNTYFGRSTDGLSWSEITAPAGTYYGVAWNGSYFLAVGTDSSNACYSKSTDGLSWSTVAYFGDAGTASCVIWDTRQWVVMKTLGTSAWTSTNGTTWTSRTVPTGNYTAIAWSGSILVAVGASNLCASSTDGITWNARTITTGSYKSITWNGSLFVAIGASVVSRSSNGIDWNASTAPANTYNAIVWNGDLFIAIGSNSSPILSTDGITFIEPEPSDFALGITLDGDTEAPIMASIPIVGFETSKIITLSKDIAWDGVTAIPAQTTIAISTTGLQAGTVEIDTTFGKKSVSSYGNKIMSKIIGGYFWSLSPGDNYVNVRNSGSPADAPTITYRPRYLGV